MTLLPGSEALPMKSTQMSLRKRVVVGISGASAPIYGVRLLQELRARDVETHLVMSRSAGVTVRLELPEWSLKQVHELADFFHREQDMAASISSGSFKTDAMVVAPCSMKSLASIAHGFSDNLLARAADVTLKERRKLILVTRETPLHLVHLRNMVAVTEMGGIILPPCPAFYHRPRSVSDIVDHTVGKVLDLLGIEHQLFQAWEGGLEATHGDVTER
jgi:4-hydroxy-3-polyprenylbenzoate decarboxylase